MNSFKIVPQIIEYKNLLEFFNDVTFCAKDLVFLSKSTAAFFEGRLKDANVIYRSDYGKGEPTDLMVEQIYQDIKELDYERVIAIGGGTIQDVAKLLVLKKFYPVQDLFERTIPAEKKRQLIIIPTTCGTGSEVTNISILELTRCNTKLGLASDALYADYAFIIPELLESLPYKFFATSSMDALIHAMESYLSPKAGSFSKMFSLKAIDLILRGYKKQASKNREKRPENIRDFLIGSTYAGIAFGNAGCGYVHAMSYSFGAKYHVPHGEANYVFFMAVFRKYLELHPKGKIMDLANTISFSLGVDSHSSFEKLASLLQAILPLKTMKEYGAKEEDLLEFTLNTMEKQGRLTANGYIPLNKNQLLAIYKSVF